MRGLIVVLLGCSVTGCAERDGAASLLGNGDPSRISIDVVLDRKLDVPRDLGFHPKREGELWIVNQGFEGAVIIRDLGTEDEKTPKYDDDISGPHFFAKPAGIAFGDNGMMATIHDTDEKTQGENGTPPDFMGPTLWTTNLKDFDGGDMGHTDMLHNTPLGMGIAWEKDNVYWVFDGYHRSVTRYDFQEDHGLGGTDHTDGIIARYIEGEVKRSKDGTPSHLWFDHATDELYVVDTGNNRVIVLDTRTGERGAPLSPNYDGCEMYSMDGADYRVFVEGADHGMVKPSGIDVQGDLVYVSDAGSPAVYAFSKSTGELVDFAEIPHDINGIAFDPAGDLYFVDPVANAVLRINRPDDE